MFGRTLPTFSSHATQSKRRSPGWIWRATRRTLVRSAVEREFAIIGGAISVLSHKEPDVFAQITHARRIVDFRNQLTHEYPMVDDEMVWAIAKRDLPLLRAECIALLVEIEPSAGAD